MNFKQQTEDELKYSGRTPDDIDFIGSASGYSCTWKEFCEMADREYEHPEPVTDLVIIFKDGGRMWRYGFEYGYGWVSSPRFTPDTKTKKITSLFPKFCGLNSFDFFTLDQVHGGHGDITKKFLQSINEEWQYNIVNRIAARLKLPNYETFKLITGENAKCLLDYLPDENLQEEISAAIENRTIYKKRVEHISA